MGVFLLAVLAGLAISIPPGPLGALCVIRTARGGLLAGMAVGLAVAVVDGLVFGSIAAVGSDFVGSLASWIQRAAAGAVALALFFVGLRVFRRAGRPVVETGESGASRYGAAGGAALLALGTPGTLPALLVLFSTFHIESVELAAAGVFSGGLAWWWTLCLVTHFVREHARKALHLLDYACGALLWLGAGAAAKFALFP